MEQKQAAPAKNEDLQDFITKVADPMRKPKPREQRISIEQGQTLDSPQSSSPEVKQVSPEVENLNNDESE